MSKDRVPLSGLLTRKLIAISGGLLLTFNIYAEPSVSELQQQIKLLKNQVYLLDQKIQQMEVHINPVKPLSR